MMNKKKNSVLSETIINGSRVFVENGEVKTILSEEIRKSGYVPVEEARKLLHAAIEKLYALNANKNNKS